MISAAGQLVTQTMAIDSLTLIHNDLPATLGEMCREVVQVHVNLLLEKTGECKVTGVEAFHKVLMELEKFAERYNRFL